MNDSIDLESHPEIEAATRPGGAWRVVVLLMLVVALGHFNRISISVAGAERIIPENGVDATRMGQIYSAFLLFYTLAMVPAGWLIDRFGARATLIAFCLGFGAVRRGDSCGWTHVAIGIVALEWADGRSLVDGIR